MMAVIMVVWLADDGHFSGADGSKWGREDRDAHMGYFHRCTILSTKSVNKAVLLHACCTILYELV